MALQVPTQEMIDNVVNRRHFLTGIGAAGLGAAAFSLVGCSDNAPVVAPTVAAAATTDTIAQIFTAALIAENLAITTYYTALNTQAVITDPNLAGPGGTALNASGGSQINVAYLQGALLEEIAHAQLLRTLLGLSPSGSGDAGAGVPTTFYYPTGTFSSLAGFVPTLLALETAFIGAYMTAVEELASMAAGYNGFSASQTLAGSSVSQGTLILYAKVAASILGVEAEHRALVRGIPAVTLTSPMYAGLNLIPANNLNYEVTAGLTGEIVGVGGSSATAAAALTPFISSGTSGFSTTGVVSVAAQPSSFFASVVSPSVMSNTTGSIPAAE